MQNSIIAKHFFATNPKVSIWISKFRKFHNLPTELLKIKYFEEISNDKIWHSLFNCTFWA
jgi:hypothetical protein